MTDQGRIFETVVMDEGLDVLGHGYVVMARDVRGFTVVPKILSICQYEYGKAEETGKPTRAKTYLPRSRASCLDAWEQINIHTYATMSPVSHRERTHLLMLLLFFLDPKSPCINNIGDVFWSTIGVVGLCRSYASATGRDADELNLALAMERKVKLRGLTRRSRTGAGPIITPPHLAIHRIHVLEV